MSTRADRATRLLARANERIAVRGPSVSFVVDDRYETTIGDGFSSCTCPARTRCYHIDVCASLVKKAAEDSGSGVAA